MPSQKGIALVKRETRPKGHPAAAHPGFVGSLVEAAKRARHWERYPRGRRFTVLPVESEALLEKWAMHPDEKRVGISFGFDVHAGKCLGQLTRMVSTVRNAAKMDPRRLQSNEGNAKERAKFQAGTGGLPATTAVVRKWKDGLLDESTLTIDRQKETCRVDPGESDGLPVQDLGVLVPRTCSCTSAKSEQFTDLLLDVHRARPTYRRSAAAASRNPRGCSPNKRGRGTRPRARGRSFQVTRRAAGSCNGLLDSRVR